MIDIHKVIDRHRRRKGKPTLEEDARKRGLAITRNPDGSVTYTRMTRHQEDRPNR